MRVTSVPGLISSALVSDDVSYEQALILVLLSLSTAGVSTSPVLASRVLQALDLRRLY